MHEHGLARELMPQLKAIAEAGGFTCVTRIDMIVGSLHGVSAETLVHSFEHVFEGTGFDGAVVTVRRVEPLEEIKAPGRDDMMTTNGWELLVSRMEGRK